MCLLSDLRSLSVGVYSVVGVVVPRACRPFGTPSSRSSKAAGLPLRPGTTHLAAVALLFLHAALAGGLHAQDVGDVRGQVTDSETGAPVSNARMSVDGLERATTTDQQGRFLLADVPEGRQTLTLEHLAYGEHGEEVLVEGDGVVRVLISVSRQVIELEPLVLEAETELQLRRRTSGHRMNELVREEIDAAARAGMSLDQLVAQQMPGVHVRPGGRPGGTCVEYRGAAGMDSSCREMTVIMDGVPVSAPSTLFPTIPLQDIERLEALSPGQAGARYGSRAGNGVLLVETRRGTRPEGARDPARLVSGFDWSVEDDPYPWSRVLGSAFLGNAIGVGLGVLAAERCLSTRDDGYVGLTSQCGPARTTAVTILGFGLPGVGGSLLTHRSGAMERTQGLLLPTAVTGTLSAASGYMAWIHGRSGDSGTAEMVGLGVLVLGTPLLTTLSDRLFRELR